jgi:hypothetical protein
MRKLFIERNLRWVKEKADYDKEMRKMEDLYLSIVRK